MQKLTKKLSLVMVALMTVFTALSYVPAKAATVVPKVQFVGEQKLEYTAGERITFNLNAANYGGRVQYRVVLWDNNTKSMKDLWNTADRYYTNWQPYGNETLPLGWTISEPGSYRITVYVKRAGLANDKTALKGYNCDSYLEGPAFTVKPAAATPVVETIAPVADVTVDEGATAVLPTEVTLNMSDKTTKTAKVTWATVDTTKVGTVVVAGTVEGTDKKASVNVVVKALPLEVKEVSATNVKEIFVKFSTKVNEDSAEDLSNYSTTAGTIKSATLSEDGKTVTLLLADGTVMTNQTEYKVTVVKVKAAVGTETASVTSMKFTVLENKLPEVVEVKTIGNKVIKVYVSEPVQTATASMFKIDDKSFFGSVSVDNNVITLKPYNPTTVLAVGEHSITAENIVDFANFKSLSQTVKVTVVEDKVAPTVVDVKATLETVVVTFSEDVDPATVGYKDFYWMSGTTKKYPAAAVVVDGNEVTLDFTSNPVPAYTTNFYVTGISDYCGNAMADATLAITATVDQARPEVVDVKVADDYKSITVKFNKNVTGADRTKYEIKDVDGDKVAIKGVTKTTDKVYVIALYDVLPEGVNTLTVTGIADTTTLKNVMLPFTTTLDEIGDETAPTVKSVSANGRQIMITFSETMSLTSMADIENYLINFNGAFRKLPTGTELTPIQDGKAVLIVLPEKIGTTTIVLGTNLTDIQIMGVEDVAENAITPYVVVKPLAAALANATLTAYSTTVAENAILSDGKTIKVRFNQPIGVAAATDFTLAGATISSVDVDGTNLVTINLTTDIGTDLTGVTLAVKAGNAMKTVTGNAVTNAAVTIKDKVSPAVELATNVTTLALTQVGNVVKISLPFSEDLATANAANYAIDLAVTRLSDNETLVPLADYTTSIVGGAEKVLVVTIDTDALDNSLYTVAVKADAKYIKDADDNLAVESDVYEADNYVDVSVSAPTVSVADIKAVSADVKVTSDETGTAYILIQTAATAAPADAAAVKAGKTGSNAVVANTEYTFDDANTGAALVTGTAYKAYIVVEDAFGNLSEVKVVDFTTL